MYGSKIIGGGGGAPSHLRLLFCKIVYVLQGKLEPVTLVLVIYTNILNQGDSVKPGIKKPGEEGRTLESDFK